MEMSVLHEQPAVSFLHSELNLASFYTVNKDQWHHDVQASAFTILQSHRPISFTFSWKHRHAVTPITTDYCHVTYAHTAL